MSRSAVADIDGCRKLMQGCHFGACSNTKKGMERREGKTIRPIPEATLVPPVVVRLVELHEFGYKYVKP